MSRRWWPAVYRAALRIYPRELRTSYGEEMGSAFDAAYAERRRRGRVAAVVFAVRAVADVVSSSLRERSTRRGGGRGGPGFRPGEFATDVRIAGRALARTPGFTAAAVVVLALGIGANGALFSAMRATLLSRLPFAEAERLVLLDLTEASTTRPSEAPRAMPWSWPKFEVLAATPGRLADPVAAYAVRTLVLTGTGEPVRLTAEISSPDYFDVLGVGPALGREFVAGDEREGVLVAMLSDGLWRQRFGADPGVVGRTVPLNGKAVEVVGIAPAGFRGLTGRAELWVTIHAGAELVAPFLIGGGQAHWLVGVGRLAPGATLASLRAQMKGIGVAAEAAYADTDPTVIRSGDARLLADARVNRQAKRAVLVLAAAAGLVLLIACANLAGLLLARASRRERETAVRLALGSGRWRVARSALAESLLLAGMGGAAGALVAWSAAGWIARAWPERFLDGGWNVRFVEARALGPDGTVIAASALLALVTGVLCAIAPALAAARRAPAPTLRGGGGPAPRMGRPDARSVLVAVELAAALVLLAGTGLMLASFQRLQGVGRGFDGHNVMTFSWSWPRGSQWADRPQEFHERLLAGLARIPGVTAAGLGSSGPLGGHSMTTRVSRAGDVSFPQGELPGIGVHYVSTEYFETLRVRLVRGRLFDGTERPEAPPVVLLNRRAAEVLFPDADAIGRLIEMGAEPADEAPAEVIGIVEDVLYDRPEQGHMPEAYFSLRQAPYGEVALVRASVEPLALLPAVRSVVASIDPELPIFGVRALEDMEAIVTGDTRLVLVLLLAFGGLALVLAATGIWAIVAYAVALRRREMGIRMALGAEPGSVVRLVLRRSAGIMAAGIGAGMLGAWWLSRLLDALLYEVRRTDPAPLIGAALLLAVVTMVAAWVPARGATRADPLDTLRLD